jgi:hypothetical protein
MQSARPDLRPEEAAEALKIAAEAAQRSVAAADYQRVGRRLIVWGIVWIIVNIAGAVRLPVDGTYAWPAVMFAGLVACAVLDIRSTRGPRGWRHAGESLVLFLAFAGFVFSSQFVIAQPTLIQVESLVTLALGMIYIVVGLTIGWRLLAVGVALMLIVIAGSAWAPDQFFYWMAAAGGGGLILGGMWLRKP